MGDLLDAQAYTLNGMMAKTSNFGKTSRNETRETKFKISTAPSPLPVYHAELDRNLVTHFHKHGVRNVLQSRNFQSMLPGIDHELKMEINPPLPYLNKFSRVMFEGKQGGNSSYGGINGIGQPPCINGVRTRVFKDAYHVADVNGRLHPRDRELMKVRHTEEINGDENVSTSARSPPVGMTPSQPLPRQTHGKFYATNSSDFFSQFSETNLSLEASLARKKQLSMVTNTSFGIKNETYESPFMRKLAGGLAGVPKPEEPPSNPDSVRSEDFVSRWDTGTASRARPKDGMGTKISHSQFIEVSKKFPPHMQHHHHYGWGDAHISTSLYKPRNTEAADARDSIKDENHAIHYINNVRTCHKAISRCPTTNAAKPKIYGHTSH